MLHESAPRFDEIANRPGTTENSLRKFIVTTHWDGEALFQCSDLMRRQPVHCLMQFRRTRFSP
jgi:hypothetical protein